MHGAAVMVVRKRIERAISARIADVHEMQSKCLGHVDFDHDGRKVRRSRRVVAALAP